VGVAQRQETTAAHQRPNKQGPARASEKMNDTAALLAPKPSRTGATNTGKPRLTAVLFRELRKPPNHTIHQP
jgi:hypothetical protein